VVDSIEKRMRHITSAILLCAAVAMCLRAQTLTILANFNGKDGGRPANALVQATDGNFYGTTNAAGANRSGTIFRMSPSGEVTTLYNFCPQAGCADGRGVSSPLVQGADGNLYGTTSVGGYHNSAICGTGCGTIFKITLSGVETTFYTFCTVGPPCDGLFPVGLVQAADGELYGTTSFGGATSDCESGCGTVYKITPGGKLTTLHTFTEAEGNHPNSAPIQAANGDFYGTTTQGGTGTFSSGSVYRMTPSGDVTSLYTFCHQDNCADGEAPYGSLVQATDGDFYGITGWGGAYGVGTVFRITPSGSLTTLYSFCAGGYPCADGSVPYAGLVQAANGDFYGTTQFGGASNSGTIFKITPSGVLTTVYSFCSLANCADGNDPLGGLIQAANGELYGNAWAGGTINAGTVYSLR